MSDVSGIPYMGPMGQGNFFAPSFSYNPQMSAGQIQSNYMPQASQGQSVLNNLYASGGGFGQQTNYYSGLGAQYSAMGQSPYGIFSSPGSGGGGGGGGGDASPYQTSSNVWSSGASPFYGGGGFDGGLGGGWGGASSSPYQSLSNVFSSGASPFNYGGAGLDWSNLYQPQQQSPFSAGNLGAGMFGGLAGGMGGAYQGPSNQIDWSSMFTGGGGGARADLYPGISTPQQQQPNDFGSLFGRGVGGTSGAPSVSETAPAAMPSAADQGAGVFGGLGGTGATPGSSAIDWSKLFGGSGAEKTDPYPDMSMPGGLNSPMTTPSGPSDTFSSRFGDWSSATTPETKGFGNDAADAQLFGAPPSGSLSDASPFSYNYNPITGRDQPSGSSATDLAAQARARLADIIGGPPVEGEVGRAGMTDRAATAEAEPSVPLPRERPTEAPLPPESPATQLYPNADAPRPPASVFPAAVRAPSGEAPEAFVVHHTSGGGTPESVVADWKANRPGIGTQYIMDRNGVVHDVAAEYNYRGTGQALPSATGIYQGSQGLANRNLVGMEIIARNANDVTPVQLQALQQFAAERYPDTPFYGHGEISTNKEANEGVRGANLILDARQAAGYPAPAPDATGTTPPVGFFDPVTGVRGPDATSPQAAPRPPADVPSSGLFPEGVPLPAARPNAEANLSQAHSLLDTKIIDLVQKNSPSQASMVPSSIANQPLREALDNTFTGGMIRSNITPQDLAKAGITQADFDKAYSQGRPSTVGPRSEASGMSDWFGDIGKYAGNPFVSSAAAEGSRDQLANMIGPRSSAFGFDPGGFGEGQYGGAFTPTETAQQGPTMPSWQSSINPTYRTPELIAALETHARELGVPPEAIVGVAGVEGSNWNPQYMTGSQAGIFQIAPDDFQTAGGRLGGLTYEQYQNATPAQQVAAYADYIRSSPNAAYLDYASGDPALTAAILQSIQFAPQSEAWSQRLLGGDTSTPVTAKRQSDELGRYNTSIDFMRNAFAKQLAGFPQSQSLPGGR